MYVCIKQLKKTDVHTCQRHILTTHCVILDGNQNAIAG